MEAAAIIFLLAIGVSVLTMSISLAAPFLTDLVRELRKGKR